MSETTESLQQKENVHREYDIELPGTARPSRTERETLRLACQILGNEGHSDNLAGQLTIRSTEHPGRFLTFSMGRAYSEVEEADFCVISDDFKVVGSDHHPSPAVRFHLWLYRARPDVRCIVHSHSQSAAALSMLGRPLMVAHMDTCMFHDDCAFLAEWPGVPTSDDEGRLIASTIGNKRSILLSNHGYLTAGKSIEEATYLAVFFERAARMQLTAEAVGPIQSIAAAAAREAHDFLLQPGIVNATFDTWARNKGVQS